MMENAALLNAIIQNAIDGIITIDVHGLIETINPAGCKLFGYLPKEVIGRNVSFLMPTPDKEQHTDYLHRYQQTGEAHIIGVGREVSGLRKDGSIFPFRLGVSDVQFADRTIYTGFIHDLSRQKEAEAQLKEYATYLERVVRERTQALTDTVTALRQAKEEVSQALEREKQLGKLKMRFVSMASHEFRTPLSAVQLSASLIDKYAFPYGNANINKHVGKIKTAVIILTTILNDFLSLEKLEVGRVEPVFIRFDLVNFSTELTEEMQILVKNNQVILYKHKGIFKEVFLDPNILKYCIINLLSNAIKYSAEGTLIEFTTEITPTAYLITIKDRGIGIPESASNHLFEPFYRANNTGNTPGTGLGLNIVKRYTRLMKGDVSYTSEIESSTIFKIVFVNHDSIK